MKKNGFTLIELLVCFVLITAVSISLFKTVLVLQEKQQKNVAENEYVSFATVLNNLIQKDLLNDSIIYFVSCGVGCYDIDFKTKGTTRLFVDKTNGVITYGSIKERIPTSLEIYEDINVNVWSTGNIEDDYNSLFTIEIPLKSNYSESSKDLKYVYQYNNITNPIASEAIYDLIIDPAGGIYNNTTKKTAYLFFPGIEFELVNPEREGYMFTGWSSNGTNLNLNGTTFITNDEDTVLTANWLAYTDLFEYRLENNNPGVRDVDYIIIEEGGGNWRIKLLSTGTFIPLIDMTIDTFMVGGGGNGGYVAPNDRGAGGGGGGRTATYLGDELEANSRNLIIIGAGGSPGGSTSAFGHPAVAGGNAASGGSGGTGGSGGAHGSSATSTTSYPASRGGQYGAAASEGAAGQGSTTCEFGLGTTTGCYTGVEGYPDGIVTAYAGGGGGGGNSMCVCGTSSGGAGGGGRGGGGGNDGNPGTRGTGGGGGGGGNDGTGGSGGTGVVVIRNAR